jgi:hypothetical protein
MPFSSIDAIEISSQKAFSDPLYGCSFSILEFRRSICSVSHPFLVVNHQLSSIIAPVSDPRNCCALPHLIIFSFDAAAVAAAESDFGLTLSKIRQVRHYLIRLLYYMSWCIHKIYAEHTSAFYSHTATHERNSFISAVNRAQRALYTFLFFIYRSARQKLPR